jgi:hypothetical protein
VKRKNKNNWKKIRMTRGGGGGDKHSATNKRVQWLNVIGHPVLFASHPEMYPA